MYALLVFSVLAASLYSILMHSYPANDKGNIFKLNFFASIVWMFILYISNRCSIHLNPEIFIWGTAYGITQALFVLFKAKAMSAGSVSITTLIGNSSLLVSILFSSMMWSEKITFPDAFGLVLLLAAMVFVTYTKSSTKADRHWKYYACAFFLLSAAIGILFKGFGKSSVSENTGDMLLVSAAVMTLFYLIVLLLTRDRTLPFPKKKFTVYVLAAGILSCLFNRFNITLSASMDAVIFFPAFNGGVLILSGALSGLIYKEKFTKMQLFGFFLAVLAIMIIGVF